jgi:hypothetical protein
MTVTQIAGRPPSAPPRSPADRRADVERTLAQERHLWLATAGDGRPHLVPLAFVQNGDELLMISKRSNRTVANLRTNPFARASLGDPRDVVIIEGTVELAEPDATPEEVRALFAQLPLNPDRVPGAIAIRLRPSLIQAWRHFGEMAGRTVMADGRWLP